MYSTFYSIFSMSILNFSSTQISIIFSLQWLIWFTIFNLSLMNYKIRGPFSRMLFFYYGERKFLDRCGFFVIAYFWSILIIADECLSDWEECDLVFRCGFLIIWQNYFIRIRFLNLFKFKSHLSKLTYLSLLADLCFYYRMLISK